MEKMIIFPELYPDEDFRSILFRYHVRSGNYSIKQTSKELFGTINLFHSHIPRMMKKFINCLPIGTGYSIEFFLKYHTLLPFFRPFITKKKYDIYMEDIIEGTLAGSRRAYSIPVVRGNPLLSDEIRYCLECLKADDKLYGECYVHLMHQIKFLDFCEIHKSRLISSCPICGEIFSSSNMLRVPLCSNNHNIMCNIKDSSENEMGFKLKIFSNIKQMITNTESLSPGYMMDKILMLLGNKGYIHYKGNINKQKFLNDLFEYYSEKNMLSLGYFYKKITNANNIRKIFTTQRMHSDPLFYLLIIQFLIGTVEGLIEYDQPYSIPLPFGCAPWRCFNCICSGYGKRVVNNCKTSHRVDYREITGTFKCELCGFTYVRRTRTGTNKNYNNDNCFVVIDRGWHWANHVLELFFSGKSISHIAKKMGSGEPAIRRYLSNKLNKCGNTSDIEWSKLKRISEMPEEVHSSLKEILLGYSQASVAIFNEDPISFYRDRILRIIERDPKVTRRDLHRISGLSKALKWIIDNDKEWLDNLIPSRSLNKKYSDSDIHKMDEEMSKKVKKEVRKLIGLNLPRPICQTSILNQLTSNDKNLIMIYKGKLNLTMNIITKNIETPHDFLLRNLPRMVDRAKSRGIKNVTYNSIASMSVRYRNCNNDTKNVIEKELNSSRYND